MLYHIDAMAKIALFNEVLEVLGKSIVQIRSHSSDIGRIILVM